MALFDVFIICCHSCLDWITAYCFLFKKSNSPINFYWGYHLYELLFKRCRRYLRMFLKVIAKMRHFSKA